MRHITSGEKELKHIVLFSNGAQSAYTAYLIAKKYGTENLILLYNPTGAEHPDSKRFSDDISRLIGVPITEKSYETDFWGLIESKKFIPNHRVPLCTLQLKKPQDNAEYETTMSVNYAKLIVDGEEIFEIDVLENIYKVEGVDILETYRNNIGA